MVALALARSAEGVVAASAVIGWTYCLLAAVVLRSRPLRWLMLVVVVSSAATGTAAALALFARLASDVAAD